MLHVQGKSKTEETCVEELIDLMHCQDHCVSLLRCFIGYTSGFLQIFNVFGTGANDYFIFKTA